MSNNGKRYDKEFKADIVRLVREEKRSVGSIVTDFGISQQTVRKWTRESKIRENPDKVIIAELQAEIKAKDKKLISTALMLLMTPGLAFLDRGRESRFMLFGHSFGKITS